MAVTVERLVSVLESCRPVIAAKYANRLRILGSRFDVDDLCQVVALKAVRNLDQFHGETDEQLAAWVYSIARNASEWEVGANNCGKRSIAREEVAIGNASENSRDGYQPASADYTPDVQAEINEQTEAMLAALSEIPQSQAAAVRMRYLECAEYSDIAEALGVSEGVARMLVSRGIKTVREVMHVTC